MAPGSVFKSISQILEYSLDFDHYDKTKIRIQQKHRYNRHFLQCVTKKLEIMESTLAENFSKLVELELKSKEKHHVNLEESLKAKKTTIHN